MKFAYPLFVAALAAPGLAFTSPRGVAHTAARNVDTSLFLEPNALTEYMAKAHEEKLKAVKDAESKKDAEIQELKKQVDELKKAPPASSAIVSPAAPPSGNVGDMSKEQMATKLLSYQQFMAKYIVEAQQEKMKAVAAAELAMKNKYEEKLKLLGSGASAPAAPPAPVQKDTTLYEGRSAKVAAAAKAGKSRWGDKENAKASGISSIPTPTAPVVEAVNGLTEVNGAVDTSDQSLFNKRNKMVAAAGKAGKSRWGEKEVAKATEMATALPSAPAAPVPVVSAPANPAVAAAVEAADHGLRNDGGVGGPSLADRINLGAQLLGGAAAPAAPQPVAASTPSLYALRNARIAAAGKAGKSRWGDLEIKKAEELIAVLPASSAAPVLPTVVATPEIEAADHGLRNDGGVGGPSLAQRVNLGASILGQ